MSTRAKDKQKAELRSFICRAYSQFSCAVEHYRHYTTLGWHHCPRSRNQLILNTHKVMCCALYSPWNTRISTTEGEAQAAWLGAGTKGKVQLCDYNLVRLENFSRLSELTSTVKKCVHVDTDLVICDNTAKMGRQLGCNWIGLCVAKDSSRCERVQI